MQQNVHVFSINIMYLVIPLINSEMKNQKYGHLKALETCYLTTNVGFIILKNESQMFSVVGLEEAVDLCLAEHRREEGKVSPTGLLTRSFRFK